MITTGNKKRSAKDTMVVRRNDVLARFFRLGECPPLLRFEAQRTSIVADANKLRQSFRPLRTFPHLHERITRLPLDLQRENGSAWSAACARKRACSIENGFLSSHSGRARVARRRSMALGSRRNDATVSAPDWGAQGRAQA